MAMTQPLLEQLYRLEDAASVQAFLDEHPFLVPILLHARPQIERHFPGAPVYLEVWVEPEALDFVELVASIAPTTSPEEAIERLHRLDDEWWDRELPATQGKLAISLEYR